MIRQYKRFCCAFYDFQQRIGNADIAAFATFMFTVFLFEILMFGIDSLFHLLIKTPFYFNNISALIIASIFGFINYIFLFRNKKFLKYKDDPMSKLQMLIIVILIFGGSLALILIAGPTNPKVR